ncbi:hypothetical protein F4825DRAFT_471853 [Nemania diffusa]|nr:hypothetical protein F4825DRAFT_471853 [Nemania diffusa]
MKNVGKLVRSILGLSLLVKGAAATAPNRSVKTLFPNTTTAANSPESTEPAIPCFPFQDPDCCVDHAVCECYNGTFMAINKQYGATSLCDPPGVFVFGNDVSSVPGWCC